MKYKEFEVKLKTNKLRKELYERINSPEKIIELEDFPDTSFYTKISENNHILYFKRKFAFLTFIEGCGVNMAFIQDNDSSFAWFEILGEKNCTVVHGISVRVDLDNGKWYRDNKTNMSDHMMNELKKWSK